MVGADDSMKQELSFLGFIKDPARNAVFSHFIKLETNWKSWNDANETSLKQLLILGFSRTSFLDIRNLVSQHTFFF